MMNHKGVITGEVYTVSNCVITLNPIICHEEILSLQPMMLPKHVDISPS